MQGTEPLVLLPGLMCDSGVWSPLFADLPPSQITQVVDYGLVSSLTAMAQLALDRAPERFALAGHSMGGRVALEVVRMAPERVTRLALLDTGYLARPAGEAGEQEASKRQALLQVARTQGVANMAHTWVQGMVHPDRLRDTALITSIVDMFSRKSPEVFACQIAALLERPDATDVLRNLAVPTLVLCGMQDAWSTPAQHAEMRALASHATLELVQAAGHMAPMEQSQDVARSLVRWLGQPRVAT
jgi:pimeloyl-ACP methyl ester carboxylesterase